MLIKFEYKNVQLNKLFCKVLVEFITYDKSNEFR